MFNIFRVGADLAHVISIGILLHTIQSHKSTKGISLKTQLLYMTVFVTRYLDLLTFRFDSFYNTILKLVYLSTTGYTIHLMIKYTKTISNYVDDFKLLYIFVPSFILSLVFNYKFTPVEILWSFSIWLESLAILPQLYMLQREGQGDLLTIHYIFALGIYRFLYIPNWIYRYFAEGKFDYISILAGILQTVVYSDFFWVYYKKVIVNSFKLPN